MKCIRLKDGIYMVHEDESKRLRVNVAYWSSYGSVSIIRKDEVIKEADSIHELCDYVVVQYKNDKLPKVIAMSDYLCGCKTTNSTFAEYVTSFMQRFWKEVESFNLAIYCDDCIKIVASIDKKGAERLA